MSHDREKLDLIRDVDPLITALKQALQSFGIEVKTFQLTPPHLQLYLYAEQIVETLSEPAQLLGWLRQELDQFALAHDIQTVEIKATINESVWSDQIQLQPALPVHYRLTQSNQFIVCGLGQLGQQCVMALKEFDVAITAIDIVNPEIWQAEEIKQTLSGHQPIIGDCRYEKTLLQAGIDSCRSILLVTHDEAINLEAAFTARKLNPEVRLVVRSSKQNLNHLLGPRLGNFVAYDPAQLSATAFSLAALGEETIGAFSIDQCPLQVVRRRVQPGDLYDRIPAYLLRKRVMRLILHQPTATHPPTSGPLFHRWHPNAVLEEGDLITYIERVETFRRPVISKPLEPSRSFKFQSLKHLLQWDLSQALAQFGAWCRETQARRNIVLAAMITPTMGLLTSVILKHRVGLSWQESISATLVLLLGGYGDVFGGLQLEQPIPGWVQAICFLTTSISLLFVLSVLGVIADSVLSAQFHFLDQRPSMPEQDHIVIFGLGQVGREVTKFLRQRQQPVVGVSQVSESETLLPTIPVITGNYFEGLTAANIKTAKGLMMLTDDQLLNLELGLMAQSLFQTDPARSTIGLVLRTTDQQFSHNLTQLLPEARSLSAYALAAEAFAGAAFGENILGLFRLSGQTILVTEYTIEIEDTLHNRLISQIAYGYGVVPIFFQRSTDAYTRLKDPEQFLMPSDHIRLAPGDRLVVLATIAGLRRIEKGDLARPQPWQLTVLQPLNRGVLFEAARVIHNVTGCSLQAAREFLDALPGHMRLELYDHQAYDLWQQLDDMKQLPTRLERLKPC